MPGNMSHVKARLIEILIIYYEMWTTQIAFQTYRHRWDVGNVNDVVPTVANIEMTQAQFGKPSRY